VLDRRGLRRDRYWEVRYAPVVRNGADAARLVSEKLDESIRSQLVSDVPIGISLSDGIDSSMTAAIATRALERRPPSFTVGFDDASLDDRPAARLASAFLVTDRHEAFVNREDTLRLIPDLVAINDEPCFAGASLRALAVARLARRHGVPVILSGDGANELFAGHPWYRGAVPPRLAAWHRLARRFSDPAPDLLARHLARIHSFEGLPGAAPFCGSAPFDPLRSLARFDHATAPHVTRLQLIDLQTLLVDGVLIDLDRASMACGVEVRVPFLDHELVEAVFSIESRVLFSDGGRKALLRRAAASWLPPEVLADDGKISCAPCDAWMHHGLHEAASAWLPEGVLVSRGLLRQEGIAAALKSGRGEAIWLLFTTEAWARHWLEPASPARAEPLGPADS
jgi:asparagine synthase (glutamine-hydrolysing)